MNTKAMRKIIFFCLSMAFIIYLFHLQPLIMPSLAKQTFSVKKAVQKPLVTFLISKPNEGYGCNFKWPGDEKKPTIERRYVFFDDESNNGWMNIDGQDIKLKREKSYDLKPLRNKKRFVWVYSNEGVTAKFLITVVKYVNEGADFAMRAVITVTKGDRKQTITANGFCGG